MQLHTCVVMLQLVDEFIPTLHKDDPTYAVRMQGLEQMKKGLATVVAGCIQSLRERDAYRDSELKRLIGYLVETLPVIYPNLPEGTRQEIPIRLQAIAKDPEMRGLIPELGQLRIALEKPE